MSANEIDTFVLLFDDPGLDQSPRDGKVKLNATLGFDLFQSRNLRTLSTNNVDAGDYIEGLLYVPTLPDDNLSNDCINQSGSLIPQNVTRLPNLPSRDDTYFIALVPWTRACVSSYLNASRSDRVSALITYIPDNSTGPPPLTNDPQWSLSDGGRWKGANKYPVYAIPGAWGFTLMNALSRYSGSIDQVPHGDFLAKNFQETDYVRLYTAIQTQTASQLPNLWAFLLIVLGIILFLMCITSFAMHFYQRRHRRDLEQRIRNGDVNLEAIGVKRIAIPREVLDDIPIITYTPHQADTIPSDLPKTSFHQPSCVICLDDFIPSETAVRSLPCHHIFHPECVDQLLLRHSSLCPTCKASVLPKGYCPVKITNVMVRRERMARRFRDVERLAQQQRAAAAATSANHPTTNGTHPTTPRPTVGAGNRMASFHRQFSLWRHQRDRHHSPPTSSSSSHPQSPPTSAGLEMTEHAACPQPPPPAMLRPEGASNRISTMSAAQAADRSERARRRINTLLGRSPATSAVAVDEDVGMVGEDDERRRPKWRRAVGAVFPGFR